MYDKLEIAYSKLQFFFTFLLKLKTRIRNEVRK